jgi:hypothetical protein
MTSIRLMTRLLTPLEGSEDDEDEAKALLLELKVLATHAYEIAGA